MIGCPVRAARLMLVWIAALFAKPSFERRRALRSSLASVNKASES